MTIAIVTSRSFLLCDQIISMNVEPDLDYINSLFSSRYNSSQNKIPLYRISIQYYSDRDDNQSQGPSWQKASSLPESKIYEASFKVIGEKNALSCFKELVSQVRAQCPDKPFLNDLVENLISGAGDFYDDPSPVEIRQSRKKKRRSKKILRRTSRSTKRSSKRNRN